MTKIQRSSTVPPLTDSKTSHLDIYETDFVRWTEQAVELLKQRKFNELDLEHLIEEIEDLGNSEKKAIRSQVTRLLMHLLKWQYQSEKRSASWSSSIKGSRKQIKRLIRDAPSLKNHMMEKLELCYQDAIEDAIDETGFSAKIFPSQCQWRAEQVLDDQFWPEA
jgi:hypothetical protein